MLQKAKDLALSTTIKVAINSQIKSYGELLEFKLNSKLKSVELKLFMKGEHDAFTLTIDKYEFSQKGDDHFVKLQGIKNSRLWLNAISNDFLEGKEFQIPSQYVKVLQVIM